MLEEYTIKDVSTQDYTKEILDHVQLRINNAISSNELTITGTKRLLTTIDTINRLSQRIGSNVTISIDSIIQYIRTGNLSNVGSIYDSSMYL